MNTREIVPEYRLSHWAGILSERMESGLGVKAFCEKMGFHENTYYYWQRKLREEMYCGSVKSQADSTGLAPAGFAEVKLADRPAPQQAALDGQSGVCIETAGMRITAGCGYPADKLAELLRMAVRPC
jgi:transposase-like protein